MDIEKTILVKFVAMPSRNKGKSEEEFHRWWSETLAPTVMPFLARHNIITYTQYHLPTNYKSAIETAFPDGSFKVSQYDGMACLYARTIEDIVSLFKDEEYLEKVFLKEAEYVDLACLEICIGYEEVYIKDGVIVS